MSKEHDLEFGRYDEAELIELADADVHGGTGFLCITASIGVLSLMDGCPTGACTNSC